MMACTQAENINRRKLSIVLLHEDVVNKYINSISINKSNSNIRQFPP